MGVVGESADTRFNYGSGNEPIFIMNVNDTLDSFTYYPFVVDWYGTMFLNYTRWLTQPDYAYEQSTSTATGWKTFATYDTTNNKYSDYAVVEFQVYGKYPHVFIGGSYEEKYSTITARISCRDDSIEILNVEGDNVGITGLRIKKSAITYDRVIEYYNPNAPKIVLGIIYK